MKLEKYDIFGISAVIFWSTVATAFKLTLRYIPPEEMVLIASITSLFFFFLFLLFTGRVKSIKKQPKNYIYSSLLLGILNPFLYYLALFNAYNLLHAQEALIINYAWPIVLSLFAIPILKQKMTLKAISGLLFGFFGVYIISTNGKIISLHFTNPFGVILAFLTTIIWSLFWLYNRKMKIDPIIKLFLNFISGTIFIIIFFLLRRIPFLSNLKGIIGGIYAGLFEMGLTFVLWLKAITLSKSSAKVSTLIFLSPFLSLFFIHFIVEEPIYISTIWGFILILSGIILTRVSTRINS